MAEKLRYVVVCGCTGSAELIAFIDDYRPTDDPRSVLRGLITVNSPSSQTLMASSIKRDEQGQVQAQHDVPDALVKERFRAANLTDVVHRDGRREWTLRCLQCGLQAQMSRSALVAIADGLAEGIDACPVVEVPGEDADEQRHLVPLGVLCHRVTRLND